MSNAVESHAAIIDLTENAAKQLKHLLSLEGENAGKGFGWFVEGGGCSGLQYGMVFDEKRADDLCAEVRGIPVVVDPFSANYLQGCLVDFNDGLTGGGFKISNPNARQACGCGKSFQA